MTTPSNEQAALERERAIDVTRGPLDVAMFGFYAAAAKPDATASEVQAALLSVHAAFSEHTNAVEVSVADTALLGAHRNATWLATKADSVAAVLEFIANYWSKVQEATSRFDLPSPRAALSTGAYRAMQRLAAKHRPEKARELRARFVELGLPFAGFDEADAIQGGTASIEWKDGEPVRADGLESSHAKEVLTSRAHIRVADASASGPVDGAALATIAGHFADRAAVVPKPNAWSIIRTKLIESPVLIAVSVAAGLSVIALGWWLGQAGATPFMKPAPAGPSPAATGASATP